eukprot:9147783-Alexandrium_andersonii.AAC.1
MGLMWHVYSGSISVGSSGASRKRLRNSTCTNGVLHFEATVGPKAPVVAPRCTPSRRPVALWPSSPLR